MSEQFTIARTGKAPLQFTGELLAEAGGKWHAGKERNRWHDLAIYRTDSDKLVTVIEYVTSWQGELGRSQVEVFDTPAEVIAFFSGHEPAGYVQGYPAHESYRERQEKLLADITAHYRDRVGAILADAGFAETI